MRRRPWWFDELLALGLALLAGAPLVLGRIWYLDDATELALPLLAELQRALQSGATLVWSDRIFGGYCALGAGQAGSYYPPNLLLLKLLPLAAAYRWLCVGHLWLLARGAVGLSRAMGNRTAATVVLAAVVALGGAVPGHHHHYNVLVGMAWCPVILWASVRVVQAASPLRPVLRLAGCVGLSTLQSHPQYLWFSLLAVLCVAGWFRAPEVSPGMVARRLVAAFALGGALAIGQLLPLLEYVRQNPRTLAGGAFEYLASGSFRPADWLRLLQPDLFGSPARGGWGESDFAYWETRGFCGLVFTTIAIAAACARKVDAPTRAGLCLALVSGFLILGEHNPAYRLLVHVPPFSLFRMPGRHVWLMQLGLAILAGRGMTLLARRRMPVQAMGLATALVLLGVVCGLLAGARQPGLAGRVGQPSLIAGGLGAALVVALAVGCRLPGLRRRRLLELALLTGLVELTVSWHSFAVTRPAGWLTPPPMAKIVANADQRRVMSFASEPEQLSDLSGVLWDVDYLTGGREALPPVDHLKPLEELARALHGEPAGAFLLDRYSVRWLVRDQPLPSPDPSLRTVRTDAGLTLFENTDARPLAYAVDPRYVEETGLKTYPGQPVRIEPVEVVERTPTRWTIRTDFDEPRQVVLAISMYPGWVVMIDGQQGFLNGAERMFMSTAVPAGDHEVVFLFDNAMIWLGAALAKLGWLAWLAVLAWSPARRLLAGRRTQT